VRNSKFSWILYAFFIAFSASVLLIWKIFPGGSYEMQRIAQWMLTVGLFAGAGFALRGELYIQLAGEGGRGVIALPALALIIAAVLLAPMPWVALLEFSYLVLLSALILLVALLTSYLSSWGWRLFGAGVALFCLAYAIFSADYIAFVWSFSNRHDFGPGFANVRLFADMAAGVMPLALLYVVARPHVSWPAAALLSLPLSVWWWMLWVSESRAALLGLVLGAAAVLLLFGRSARWPLLTLALSAMIGLLGGWFLNPLVGSGAEGERFLRDIASSSGRMALWGDALRYSLENFPLGLGPMMFAGDGNLRSASAHNLIFNIAAEWGLPLALLLLALLLYASWVIAKRARRLPEADKPVYACLVMAFVSVMVNVQFAGAHIAPVGSLVLALATGLALGYSLPALGSSASAGRAAPAAVPVRATVLWAALMLLLAYALLAGAELYWLAADSATTCFQSLGRAYYYPRFWPQGRLECMQEIAPNHWLFWRW